MGLRWMLLLIRLCVRTKAESGYVEVHSVTAAVVSVQSTPASSAKVYPSAYSSTEGAAGEKEEEAYAGQPDAHGADRG